MNYSRDATRLKIPRMYVAHRVTHRIRGGGYSTKLIYLPLTFGPDRAPPHPPVDEDARRLSIRLTLSDEPTEVS